MMKRSGDVTKGSGFGALGNLIIGMLGGAVGGTLFALWVGGTFGLWGSIAVAFLGGYALVLVVQAVAPGRPNP